MSAQNKSKATESELVHDVAEYLRKNVSGTEYLKSKDIADNIALSPKQVGYIITDVDEYTTDLSVEKWSYRRATTWKVSRST